MVHEHAESEDLQPELSSAISSPRSSYPRFTFFFLSLKMVVMVAVIAEIYYRYFFVLTLQC